MVKFTKRLLILALCVAMLLPAVLSFAENGGQPKAGNSSAALTPIKGAQIQVAKSGTYNGKKHTAKVIVRLNGKTLTAGTDYVVSGNVTSAARVDDYTLKVKVSGVGHYAGTVSTKATYKILRTGQKVSYGTTSFIVKAATLKKKAVTVSVNSTGNKTGLLLKGASQYGITLSNRKTGAIVLPKGLRKGTYKFQVYACKGTNYKRSAYQQVMVIVK